MSAPALVLLNPAARGGTAVPRFRRVLPYLAEQYRLRILETDPGRRWVRALEASVARGTRVILAAGGDGTVHAAGDALLEIGAPRDVVLGGVGLGSSNDFHKPVRCAVAGVPLRIDARRARPRDVLVAEWEADGVVRREVALISASFGITAEANALFNHPNRGMEALKRAWTGAAIAYAAVFTVLRHPGVAGRIELPGDAWQGAIASLSILETPHLAGVLRFDVPAADDDGAVTVALLEAAGPARLLVRLAGLCRGRFSGAPGTRHWRTPELTVELDRPGPLELDGEVRIARRVRFELLPGRVRTCA